jgi:hypothetical protein
MTNTMTTARDKTDPLKENRVLDHSVLLSFMGGDEKFLSQMCALFLATYPAYISQIRDAIARDDSEALARAAHTLRGSGGYFFPESALTIIIDLEKISHRRDLKSAPARLVDLEAELNRMKPELSLLAGETEPEE